MKEVCVDASVIVKVAIPEALSVQAKALFTEIGKKGIEVIVPPTSEVEIDSAIRWQVKHGILTRKEGKLAFNTVDV